MRILYFLGHPKLYGSELHLLQIARYFVQKHEVLVITFEEGPLLTELAKYGVPYRVIPAGWLLKPALSKEIETAVKDFAPDILHAHQPKAAYFASRIGKRLKIPVLSTVHSRPVNNANLYKGVRFYVTYAFHFWVKLVSEFLSDRLIFVSQTFLKESLFKKKSLVMPNWISPDYPAEVPAKSFPKNRAWNILCTGSVTPAKGYEMLLDFVAAIRGTDYKLTIVGAGEEAYIQELKNRAAEYGILQRVEFLGYQPNPARFYLEADIFALFSMAETFGLAYAEAAYFGLPVFARNLQVLKEILPDGNILSGDLIALKQGWLEITGSARRYERQSHANTEFVKTQFGYEPSMQRLEELYAEMTMRKTRE